MAIGDTINAGLMRTDFSALQQTGHAQANAAFGNAVGNFIEGHYKKKKEKEDRLERKNFYLAQGFDEDEATAASGDKELGKSLERKREAEWREGEADRNFKLAEEAEKRFSDSAKFSQSRLKTADQLVADERIGTENLSRFLMARPQIQIDDPRFEIPKVDPDPSGPSIMPQMGKAPALAPLTGAFARYGEEIQQGVESGQISAKKGLQAIETLQARQDALTPPPMTPSQVLAYHKMIEDMERSKAEEGRKVEGEKRDVTTFKQGQSFLTFTPENNFLAISTGEKVTKLPISGVVGNEKLAGDLKNEISAFNDMDQLFSRLITLSVEEDWVDSEILKTEANGLVKSIQGRIRENILGPGTVTDSERAILDQIVTNPYSKTMLLSTEDKVNLLQKLRTQTTNNFYNRLTNSGLDIGQSSGGSSPSAPSDALDDGTTYEVKFDLEK